MRCHPGLAIAAAPAFLLALLAGTACQKLPLDPRLPDLVENGLPCGPEGDPSCKSGHCDHGLCCTEGVCCLSASDCPDSYHAAPVCDTYGSATDCQGTRRDATCQDATCVSMTVPDDSACAGLARDCGRFDPLLCTSAVEQPVAVCSVVCSGDSECLAGHACVDGSCKPITGLGTSCTGTGQGSCAAGLKCENGVCCGASGSSCCSPANGGAECAGGLACDDVTFSCFATCNDYDGWRCASPDAYCLGNACHPKRTIGAACAQPAQCASGVCECFDAHVPTGGAAARPAGNARSPPAIPRAAPGSARPRPSRTPRPASATARPPVTPAPAGRTTAPRAAATESADTFASAGGARRYREPKDLAILRKGRSETRTALQGSFAMPDRAGSPRGVAAPTPASV